MSGNSRRIDGDGSIYQRHDRGCPPLVDGVRPDHKCTGPWVGALVTDWRDGKPVRRKVSARTRSGAAAKLNELKDRRATDDLPAVGKAVTVEEWMRYWLDRIVPRAKPAAGTVKAYNTVVGQYVIPLLGHHRLDRLTPEHIDEAWETLLDDGNPRKDPTDRVPIAPNTVHLAHTVLRRALKVAVQRKRLKTNPAGTDSMDAPPRDEKEVEPVPPAEVVKILAAAEGTPYGARWSVALALGLRPGEALGLRWSDVDLDAGVLHVRQQLQRVKGKGLVATAPKSEAGKRWMNLPPTLLAGLKAHRKSQNEARLRAGDHWTDTGLVFTLEDGRGIDARVDRLRWHELLTAADVPQHRLYDARHSAATLLLIQGVEPRVVMALLGHSQISVTMKYQHAVDELRAGAATKIEAGMWGG
jgi:integrase